MDGTVAEMEVSELTVAVACTPLKLTVVLLPEGAVKPLPVICTVLFAEPVVGDKEVTSGLGIVNITS